MRLLRQLSLILCISIIGFYVLLCGLLFVYQRSLIYYPQPRNNSETSTLVSLAVGDETVQASAHLSVGSDAVIYFGGNAEDVSMDVPDLVSAFPNKAIYALHYPGYGGSSGGPSQKSIFAASLALFDRVHGEHPNIIIIGRSLGSGVAVWVASQRPIARLVLITPFDSLADPAGVQFPFLPVRWLLRDKFESWKYAPKVTAPTRIIVAEDDEVVPRFSSERLRTRFRTGTISSFIIPKAGHNTLQNSRDYWSLISSE